MSYRSFLKQLAIIFACVATGMAIGAFCGRMIGSESAQADDLPRGVIAGKVEIVDCTENGGDYEWQLARPKRFKVPLKSERRPQPSFWRAF